MVVCETSPHFQREFATAPVGRAIGWLSLCRPFKNTRLLPFAARARCLSTVAGIQSGQTLLHKSALPPSNEIGVTVQFVANQSVAFPHRQATKSNAPRLACAASRNCLRTH